MIKLSFPLSVIILFSLGLFFAGLAHAQPTFATKNEELNKRFAQFYSALTHEDLNAHQRPGFYEKVISSFFDTTKMGNIFQELYPGTPRHFALDHQLDMLKRIDSFLHFIEQDSIVVIDAVSYYSAEVEDKEVDYAKEQKSHFFGGVKINDKIYPLLDVKIDSSSKLFIAVMPVIYFDREMGSIVYAFLEKRRKKIKT